MIKIISSRLRCENTTCQVLILTPLVVSLRTAVSKITFVTMPVELFFPRLPMLKNKVELEKGRNNFTQKRVFQKQIKFSFLL